MKRLLIRHGVGAAVLAFSCFASLNSVSAQLDFDDPINLNLSNIPGVAAGIVDVLSVQQIDFIGNVAINSTDQDGSAGPNPAGDGTTGFVSVSVNDTSRLVGFADNDGVTLTGGSNIAGGLAAASLGHTTTFEITTVIRDWNGTIIDVTVVPAVSSAFITTEWDVFARTNAGDLIFPTGTGFVDLYLDTADDYSATNAEASATGLAGTGIWFGTFGVTDVQSTTSSIAPRTVTTVSPFPSTALSSSGNTRVGLQLIAAPSLDIWTDTLGNPLLGSGLVLASFIASTETPIPNPPLTNIFGGAMDPVNVTPAGGSAFFPPTATSGAGFPNAFPFDNVAVFDSSNTFAVVPEPSSLLLCSLGALGLAGYRRRRKTTATC